MNIFILCLIIWICFGLVTFILDLIYTIKKYYNQGISILDLITRICWFIGCLICGTVGFIIYMQIYYKIFTIKYFSKNKNN